MSDVLVGRAGELTTLLPSEPPSLERGEVLAELALNRVFDGDPVEAAAAARESLDLAERCGSRALAARAHAYLGLAGAEDTSAAMESFARARAAAREAGDPRILLDVAVWESSALVAAGAYETAVEVVQQGLRTAHETFRFAESAPILLVKYAACAACAGALGRRAGAGGGFALRCDAATEPRRTAAVPRENRSGPGRFGRGGQTHDRICGTARRR